MTFQKSRKSENDVPSTTELKRKHPGAATIVSRKSLMEAVDGLISYLGGSEGSRDCALLD